MRCIFSPDEAHFDRTGVPGNSLSYCWCASPIKK